jgi:hypothetical protein
LAPRDLERAANSRFGQTAVGTPSKINMTIASAAEPGAAGRHEIT